MHRVADILALAILQHGLVSLFCRRPRHIGTSPDGQHVILVIPFPQRLHFVHGPVRRFNEYGRHAVFLAGILKGPDKDASDPRGPHPFNAGVRQLGVLVRIKELADGRAAAFQRFHARELRRQLMLARRHDLSIGQRGQVQPLDQPVIRAQALEEGLEDVDVRIDKPRKQYHSIRVDFLNTPAAVGHVFSDPRDPVSLYGNVTAVDDALVTIHGMDHGVSYDQIICVHWITS